MTDRLPALLLLVGCLVLGAIIFVELQPEAREDPAAAGIARRTDTGPAVRRQANPRIDDLVGTVLARPLFTSTRRPPQSASNGAADGLADARLTGIVTEPGRRVAIFAVKGEKPLSVAEGEAVNGWRIESITPSEVSLSGPTGTKTLQPKFDPNLAKSRTQVANAVGRPPVPPARPAVPPA
ncbi:MAG: hypothetical protein J2P48_10195, partial [Alphaproteobacteria bacterium]|nr:hypothetical protein [Alphaproteobacteria bacterium]